MEGRIEDAHKFIHSTKRTKIPTLQIVTIPDYTEEELPKILKAEIKRMRGKGHRRRMGRTRATEICEPCPPKRRPQVSLFSSQGSGHSQKSALKTAEEREEEARAEKTPEHIFFTKSDMLGLSAAEVSYGIAA